MPNRKIAGKRYKRKGLASNKYDAQRMAKEARKSKQFRSVRTIRRVQRTKEVYYEIWVR